MLLSTAGFVDDEAVEFDEVELDDVFEAVDEEFEDVLELFWDDDAPPEFELDVVVEPPHPANISVAADVNASTVSHGFFFTNLPP